MMYSHVMVSWPQISFYFFSFLKYKFQTYFLIVNFLSEDSKQKVLLFLKKQCFLSHELFCYFWD